jgi:type III restriction enzyme
MYEVPSIRPFAPEVSMVTSGEKRSMENRFFERPILNSPYRCPARHWELDASGQPTQQIIENRRRAEFITPIPKPRKRKGSAARQQIIFDEGKGLSSAAQQYDPTPVINELRRHVDEWRGLKRSSTN